MAARNRLTAPSRPRARGRRDVRAGASVTFYTTEAVLIELLTFFSNRGTHLRHQVALFVEDLRASSPTILIPQTPALFEAAFDLYRRRADKTYSMVDCIGMVVCRQQSITDVLTADQDFAQEGLVVLLA